MDEFKAGDVVAMIDPETGAPFPGRAWYLDVLEVLSHGVRLQSRQTALKNWDIVCPFDEVVKVQDD